MAAGVPFGRYTLVRRLARGGMAEIFLALQEGPEGFSRRLVIKRILPHLAADSSFLQMFLDEARIVAMLSHPHIVHLYDFGEVEGSYFLAMEYIEGVDLQHLGDRIGPVPPEHAAKIMSYVCEGLSHAHELTVDGRLLGLVHRDVTPSNILISYDGSVKVADFGIAKTYSGDDRTRAGVVKGKFAYLSPEQARGLPLDHRSDQFNIGILLYETLTGAHLFPHDSFQRAMRAIIGGQIEPPDRIQPSVPARLSEIVMRALAPRREDRYTDTLALRADLEAFLREWPQPSDAVVIGRFVRNAFPDRQTAQHTGALPQGTAPLIAGTAPAAIHTRTAAPSGIVAGPAGPIAGPILQMPPALIVPTKKESPLSRASDEEDSSGLGVALVDPDSGETNLPPPGLHDAPTDLHGAFPDLEDGDELLDEDPMAEEATRTQTRIAPERAATAPSAWDVGQSRRRRRTIAVSVSVGLAAAAVTTMALLWTGGAPADQPPATPPTPTRPAVHRTPPADLQISSAPAGARISIDGEPTAYLTPSIVTVRGDVEHRVRLSLGGYVDAERVIGPSPGRIVSVHATLPPEPAVAEILDGGTTVADGGALTIAEVEVPAGPQEPSTRPSGRHGPRPRGGAPDRVPVREGAGSHTPPPAATGLLSVNTIPWSKVYLGGRYLGQTPMGERRVPVGRHVLRLVNPERGERTLTITIEPDQTKRVSLSL